MNDTTPQNIKHTHVLVPKGFLAHNLMRLSELNYTFPNKTHSYFKGEEAIDQLLYKKEYATNIIILTFYRIIEIHSSRKFTFEKDILCFNKTRNHLDITKSVLSKLNEGMSIKDLVTYCEL